MNIKLSTVNVIEMENGDLVNLNSFSNNKKGYKKAEKLFMSLIKSKDLLISEDEIKCYLNYGRYDYKGGTIFLIYSN